MFLVCGQKSVRAQTLIVNGEKTKYGEYPWQAAIFKDGRFICSGALISENIILTGLLVLSVKDREETKLVLLGHLKFLAFNNYDKIGCCN